MYCACTVSANTSDINFDFIQTEDAVQNQFDTFYNEAEQLFDLLLTLEQILFYSQGMKKWTKMYSTEANELKLPKQGSNLIFTFSSKYNELKQTIYGHIPAELQYVNVYSDTVTELALTFQASQMPLHVVAVVWLSWDTVPVHYHSQ